MFEPSHTPSPPVASEIAVGTAAMGDAIVAEMERLVG